MRVTITVEHIRNGCKRNCERCPVAQAVSDALDENLIVYVDDCYVTVGARIYKLPFEVTRFIQRFDDWQGIDLISLAKEFKPFSFSLPETFEPSFLPCIYKDSDMVNNV